MSARRPRVLIVGPAPPPPGGIATVIQMIVESELSRRFELARFSTSQPRFGRRALALRALDALLARGLGFDGAGNLEARAKLRAFGAALEPRPDIVHLHCSHGYDFWLSLRMARALRRRGIPSLLHLHGLFDVVVPGWSRARRALLPRALRTPDRVVVLSEGWQRWFGQFVAPERLIVLRNPVDVSRFRRPAPRGEGPLRALFVGTSEPERKGGYDVLAAAAEIVRRGADVRFVFVGEDTERLQATRVEGTPLAGRVEFAGSRSAAEMAPFFEAADLLLLPSYAEGLPMALLEGMAAGLPIVATPVNGIPEVMSEPENGILVPPGDPAAIARAVLELAADPERRARIGRANRCRAEAEYDCEHYAHRLGEVYDGLLRPGAV